MSATQFGVGVAVVAGAFHLAVLAVTPPMPPITVHSLRYVPECTYKGVEYTHCIEQDRTITADGEVFYMFWSAQTQDESGKDIVECSGKGSFPYPVGRKAATMPLHIWSGNSFCNADILRGKKVTPFAVWHFGEDQVARRGEPFVIGEQ